MDSKCMEEGMIHLSSATESIGLTVGMPLTEQVTVTTPF